MCNFRKYPYSLTHGRFLFGMYRQEIPVKLHTKILAFKTPFPIGICDDLPWGGYGFSLKLHNAIQPLVMTN